VTNRIAYDSREWNAVVVRAKTNERDVVGPRGYLSTPCTKPRLIFTCPSRELNGMVRVCGRFNRHRCLLRVVTERHTVCLEFESTIKCSLIWRVSETFRTRV
jgi:hypothetical protein